MCILLGVMEAQSRPAVFEILDGINIVNGVNMLNPKKELAYSTVDTTNFQVIYTGIAVIVISKDPIIIYLDKEVTLKSLDAVDSVTGYGYLHNGETITYCLEKYPEESVLRIRIVDARTAIGTIYHVEL